MLAARLEVRQPGRGGAAGDQHAGAPFAPLGIYSMYEVTGALTAEHQGSWVAGSINCS